MLPTLLADIVDGDDVRVLQFCRRPRLPLKSFDIPGTGEDARADHFEGDDAIKAGVSGFIDDSHPPTSEYFEQFVAAEPPRRPLRKRCVFRDHDMHRPPWFGEWEHFILSQPRDHQATWTQIVRGIHRHVAATCRTEFSARAH